MSAERRWDQRRFHLEESLTQNGGARTVFIEYMTPGTTVPPHYHTRQYKPLYTVTILPHAVFGRSPGCTISCSAARY